MASSCVKTIIHLLLKTKTKQETCYKRNWSHQRKWKWIHYFSLVQVTKLCNETLWSLAESSQRLYIKLHFWSTIYFYCYVCSILELLCHWTLVNMPSNVNWGVCMNSCSRFHLCCKTDRQRRELFFTIIWHLI